MTKHEKEGCGGGGYTPEKPQPKKDSAANPPTILMGYKSASSAQLVGRTDIHLERLFRAQEIRVAVDAKDFYRQAVKPFLPANLDSLAEQRGELEKIDVDVLETKRLDNLSIMPVEQDWQTAIFNQFMSNDRFRSQMATLLSHAIFEGQRPPSIDSFDEKTTNDEISYCELYGYQFMSHSQDSDFWQDYGSENFVTDTLQQFGTEKPMSNAAIRQYADYLTQQIKQDIHCCSELIDEAEKRLEKLKKEEIDKRRTGAYFSKTRIANKQRQIEEYRESIAYFEKAIQKLNNKSTMGLDENGQPWRIRTGTRADIVKALSKALTQATPETPLGKALLEVLEQRITKDETTHDAYISWRKNILLQKWAINFLLNDNDDVHGYEFDNRLYLVRGRITSNQGKDIQMPTLKALEQIEKNLKGFNILDSQKQGDRVIGDFLNAMHIRPT